MYISEKLMISPKLLLRLFWFQNMFITHEQRKSLEIYHLYFSINSQRLQPLSLIYQARTKSVLLQFHSRYVPQRAITTQIHTGHRGLFPR